jgi:hypothetical protein
VSRTTIAFTLALTALAVSSASHAQEAATPPWRRAPTRARPAPATVEVEDFTTDAEGRVTLLLESVGAPQRVIFERRRVTDTAPPRGAPPPRTILGSGTCTTPCVLHVPPGPLVVRTEGTGLRRADLVYDAPTTDARIVFRAGSQSRWNVGVGLVAVGSTMLVALAGLGLLSQTSGGPELPTASVIGVSLGGAALLGVGVPMLLFNLSGIDHATPIAPSP